MYIMVVWILFLLVLIVAIACCFDLLVFLFFLIELPIWELSLISVFVVSFIPTHSISPIYLYLLKCIDLSSM